MHPSQMISIKDFFHATSRAVLWLVGFFICNIWNHLESTELETIEHLWLCWKLYNSLKYVFMIFDCGQICVSVLDFLLWIIRSLHIQKEGTRCFGLFSMNSRKHRSHWKTPAPFSQSQKTYENMSFLVEDDPFSIKNIGPEAIACRTNRAL